MRLEQATADRLNFSIMAPSMGREFMTFCLHVTPSSAGNRSQVQVSITTFKTVQNKVYGIIPAGSKRMHGYGHYERFMKSFASGLKIRDPHAPINLTDGVGSMQW